MASISDIRVHDLMSAEELRSTFERDGFVKIPNVLSSEELDRYRTACQRTAAKARRGQWPHVRTLPKQFPPWLAQDAEDNGIWGVQHLLHPDMPDRDVFAASYFHHTLVAVILKLLACSEDDLVLELYNMLLRPSHDFALRWHRDGIGPDASPEEELQRLGLAPMINTMNRMVHAQWNLALYHDASLVVVPGSHQRARTAVERAADPYEDDMPGQMVVNMSPGDIVLYNNNILHRGVYDSTVERMTLHGSMGITRSDPERARNILQHGIGAWVADADFTNLPGRMSELAECMKARLIAMGRGDGLGFVHGD